MRQPEFYAAVFGIIRNNEGKVLTIKRKNTGYSDGYYWLPAGHIEWIETPTASLRREILEEVGLDVEEKDMKFLISGHRISPQSDGSNRVYFDFYYEILRYSGTPINGEPEKSEWTYWINWKQETKIQFREYLEQIELGNTYFEIDYRL